MSSKKNILNLISNFRDPSFYVDHLWIMSRYLTFSTSLLYNQHGIRRQRKRRVQMKQWHRDWNNSNLPPPPESNRDSGKEDTMIWILAQQAALQPLRYNIYQEEVSSVCAERLGDRHTWRTTSIRHVLALAEVVDRYSLRHNMARIRDLRDELGTKESSDELSNYVQEQTCFHIPDTVHCDRTNSRDAFGMYYFEATNTFPRSANVGGYETIFNI